MHFRSEPRLGVQDKAALKRAVSAMICWFCFHGPEVSGRT